MQPSDIMIEACQNPVSNAITSKSIHFDQDVWENIQKWIQTGEKLPFQIPESYHNPSFPVPPSSTKILFNHLSETSHFFEIMNSTMNEMNAPPKEGQVKMLLKPTVRLLDYFVRKCGSCSSSHLSHHNSVIRKKRIKKGCGFGNRSILKNMVGWLFHEEPNIVDDHEASHFEESDHDHAIQSRKRKREESKILKTKPKAPNSPVPQSPVATFIDPFEGRDDKTLTREERKIREDLKRFAKLEEMAMKKAHAKEGSKREHVEKERKVGRPKTKVKSPTIRNKEFARSFSPISEDSDSAPAGFI